MRRQRLKPDYGSPFAIAFFVTLFGGPICVVSGFDPGMAVLGLFWGFCFFALGAEGQPFASWLFGRELTKAAGMDIDSAWFHRIVFGLVGSSMFFGIIFYYLGVGR
ncbi:MAG: hypothetical protein GC160_00450 [Acidobacteria bacterium]|nr:hypothetical protein [Acidobacteriota bacterium]